MSSKFKYFLNKRANKIEKIPTQVVDQIKQGGFRGIMAEWSEFRRTINPLRFKDDGDFDLSESIVKRQILIADFHRNYEELPDTEATRLLYDVVD